MLQPVFNPFGLTALTAANVAAGDVLPIGDLSAVATKKIAADSLLDAVLRVAATGALLDRSGNVLRVHWTNPGGGVTASLQFVRDSDSQVGVRVLAHSGLQMDAMIFGSVNTAITDDGASRLRGFSGTNNTYLVSSGSGTTQVLSGSQFIWDGNATAIGGSSILGLYRSSASILGIHDGDSTADTGLAIQAKSSTTNKRDRLQINTAAADNTDATRKYRAIFNVYDTAAREVGRMEADGSRGYWFQTVHTTAPADALLPNGSVAFYTDGSGDLVVKLKDSGGTVRTGTVDLT